MEPNSRLSVANWYEDSGSFLIFSPLLCPFTALMGVVVLDPASIEKGPLTVLFLNLYLP